MVLAILLSGGGNDFNYVNGNQDNITPDGASMADSRSRYCLKKQMF
jgi:hypothetical protein